MKRFGLLLFKKFYNKRERYILKWEKLFGIYSIDKGLVIVYINENFKFKLESKN